MALDSTNPTLFACVVLIPTRDPFFRVNKDFEGSTVHVEEVRRQVEDASLQEVVPSPKARSHPIPTPSKLAESAAPHVVAASKGKTMLVEYPKKKRKLFKTVEVEPKRTNLMSSAMPPATIIEVCFIQFSFELCTSLL